MKKRVWLTIILLAVMSGLQACQPSEAQESGQENEPRTYYESLDLETPENAVQTFAQAFQREDFMTVYLVFDYGTQRQIRMANGATFRWTHLIGSAAEEHLWDDIDPQEVYAQQNDFWYIFDQIMLYAAKENDLLIDLRGDTAILRNEESLTSDDRPAVDVIASVSDISGEVIFRVVTDLDDRWRVYSVSAPDEHVEAWPFLETGNTP